MGRTWPRVKNVENTLERVREFISKTRRLRYDELVLEYYVVATK